MAEILNLCGSVALKSVSDVFGSKKSPRLFQSGTVSNTTVGGAPCGDCSSLAPCQILLWEAHLAAIVSVWHAANKIIALVGGAPCGDSLIWHHANMKKSPQGAPPTVPIDAVRRTSGHPRFQIKCTWNSISAGSLFQFRYVTSNRLLLTPC